MEKRWHVCWVCDSTNLFLGFLEMAHQSLPQPRKQQATFISSPPHWSFSHPCVLSAAIKGGHWQDDSCVCVCKTTWGQPLFGLAVTWLKAHIHTFRYTHQRHGKINQSFPLLEKKWPFFSLILLLLCSGQLFVKLAMRGWADSLGCLR